MRFVDRQGQVRTANIEALATILGLPQYELPEPSLWKPTLIPQIKWCIENQYLEMVQDLFSPLAVKQDI
jgi:hypothetical protein